MISKNSFKKIAVTAALAGDSKKASPVRVYDLGGRSPLADYAVLMMVESAPQLDAAEEEVLHKLKQDGVYCLHKDGMQSKNWKVLDYGGVLVHIYDVKAEEFYSIGKVYESYKPVEWQEAPAARPAAPAPVKEAAKPAAPKKAAPAKKAKPAAKKAKPAAKKAKPAAKKAKPAAKKAKPAAKKAKPAAKKAKAAPKKAKPVKKAAAKKAKPAKKAAKKISRKKK